MNPNTQPPVDSKDDSARDIDVPTKDDELKTFVESKSEYWFMYEVKTGNWVVDEVSMMRDLVPFIEQYGIDQQIDAVNDMKIDTSTRNPYPTWWADMNRHADKHIAMLNALKSKETPS